MKTTTPIPQVVSKDQFKRAVHILEADDDTLFDAYLMAAQDVVEIATHVVLSPRSIEFQTRHVGQCRWWFPVRPVTAVTAVHWMDDAGVWVDLGLPGVRLEMPDDEPQIVFASGYLADVPDGAAIRVTADVGHPAAAAPLPLQQAIILLVKDWFEVGVSADRSEVFRAESFVDVSWGVRRLMKQSVYNRPLEWSR